MNRKEKVSGNVADENEIYFETYEYELEREGTSDSGFSVFLKILAWIAWIGGIIIAVSGANVEVIDYRSTKTEFSFSVFLTLLIPYAINGLLLFGLAKVVGQVDELHQIISGLALKKNKVKVPVKNVRTDLAKKNGGNGTIAHGSETDKENIKRADNKPTANVDSRWISTDDGFAICPSCSSRASVDFLKCRKACPDCGEPYQADLADAMQSDEKSSSASPAVESSIMDQFLAEIDSCTSMKEIQDIWKEFSLGEAYPEINEYIVTKTNIERAYGKGDFNHNLAKLKDMIAGI